jgi:succinate dehydrogenase / fumarate reductase, cytochrome b subunit
VKDQRPKNLNLFTIRFPLPAIVSILHRISGIILFILIPFALWGLQLSLTSEQDFTNLQLFFSNPVIKIIIWSFLSAFIYHFVAGIRHLLMDVHIGEGLQGGRFTSVLTLIISIILIALMGIWLW